jgi:FKBP-type peptidyl-prolyl cis-trans isomerase FkpA
MCCHSFKPFSFLSILLTVMIVTSCVNEPQPARTTGNPGNMGDSIISYNKAITKTEDQDIEDFISRYHWEMMKTGTGLRYMIYKHGTGQKAEPGKTAVLKFEVRLITGDLIYSSATEGLKEFVIGHGGVESGLEEGILLLRTGDRAKFIVPSYLAFGLLGDLKKIPQRATLVYDIEFIRQK